jgi:hypothetical protein
MLGFAGAHGVREYGGITVCPRFDEFRGQNRACGRPTGIRSDFVDDETDPIRLRPHTLFAAELIGNYQSSNTDVVDRTTMEHRLRFLPLRGLFCGVSGHLKPVGTAENDTKTWNNTPSAKPRPSPSALCQNVEFTPEVM